jgi:hypothetical protein
MKMKTTYELLDEAERLLYRWMMRDSLGEEHNPDWPYQDTWNYLGLGDRETMEMHKKIWLERTTPNTVAARLDSGGK